MEIKKNYDVKELAGKLRGRIKISNESDTRFVDIDMLTAVNILDVLEEVSRRETIERIETAKPAISVPEKLQPASPAKDGNEILPENMKAGCDDKPRCYGKYTVDNAQERDCTHCPDEVSCYLKSLCRKKCFGTYENDSSICANCKYICECKKVTEERKMENSKCFGWYSSSSVECRFCKNVEDCRIEAEKQIKSEEWDDE